MNINDIFIPMVILTNYNEYKTILKNSKDKLKKVRSPKEKNKLLKECETEINRWHKILILKSGIILVLFCAFFIFSLCKLKLNYNDYIISLLIIIYIICFILEKYRNKESIINEILEYASEIKFIDLKDIKIF